MAVAGKGEIDELLRYYHAGRLLRSCLLLPLTSGVLYAYDTNAVYPFVIWLCLIKVSGTAIRDLAIYSGEEDFGVKSTRWRAVLWSDVRHMLAGYASIVGLLALLHLLHGKEFLLPTPHAPVAAQELPEAVMKQHLALVAILWTASMMPFAAYVLTDEAGKKRKWTSISIVLFVALSPLKHFLLLLPSALALPIYLLGLASRTPARRDALIVMASQASMYSTLVVFCFFVMFMFFNLISPGIPPWALDPVPFVMMLSAFALSSFMQHEIIRRGLFPSNLAEVNQKKLPFAAKKRLAKALNPLDRTEKFWRWARFVIGLGKYAWLVALASILLAAAISFA